MFSVLQECFFEIKSKYHGTRPKFTNRLLSESTAKVMVETFDDTEVPNPSSEARIYEMLDQLLIDSREIIKEQSSQLWSSVFYENENYRPDQVTQTVSDIYRRFLS